VRFDAAALLVRQPNFGHCWRHDNHRFDQTNYDNNNNLRIKTSSLGYTSPSSPFDLIAEYPMSPSTSSSSSAFQFQRTPIYVNEQTYQEEDITCQYHPNSHEVTLIPMSTEPLMFWSSQPLLSPEECQVLSHYFSHKDNYHHQHHRENYQQQFQEEKDSYSGTNNDDDDYAQRLLQRLWKKIDQLTLSPFHSGESPLPNYLSYSAERSDFRRTFNPNNNNGWLFPNGLHVDTNNGKLFRHLTILLYLTTPYQHVRGGATNFPLAKPMKHWRRRQQRHGNVATIIHSTRDQQDNHNHHNDSIMTSLDDDNDDDKEHDQDMSLWQAAQALVQAKLHHTQFSKNEQMKHYGHMLEEAAVQLFQREENHVIPKDTSDPPNFPLGIRVVPKAGHICVFCNLLDNGECDPRSFHGAEQLFQIPPSSSSDAQIILEPSSSSSSSWPTESNPSTTIITSHKKVLTFFKEIPLHQFSNQQEFAQRVAEIRRHLLQRYVK
jgi:hypothetical protein